MIDLSNENIIHIKKGNIEYLQFRKLLEYEDILTHAYSLGLDKNFRTAKVNKENLPKEEYEKVVQDYIDLCDAIGANYLNLVKTNQEHTGEVKIVDKKINKESPDFNLEIYQKTDGFISNKKNLILSTTNADCNLILLFDPIKKVIANVHSGWRGTVQKIAKKAVLKMEETFKSNPEDIICCICPSIRKCHFEVDEDVKNIFQENFENIENEIEEKISNKKWHIDTIEINKKMLEEVGIKRDNIIDSKICSICNKELIHSYRIEKEMYGLNTALIELK